MPLPVNHHAPTRGPTMGDNYDARCHAIHELITTHLPHPDQPIPRPLWDELWITATGLSHVSARTLTSHGARLDLWTVKPGNRRIPGFVHLLSTEADP